MQHNLPTTICQSCEIIVQNVSRSHIKVANLCLSEDFVELKSNKTMAVTLWVVKGTTIKGADVNDADITPPGENEQLSVKIVR